VSKTHIGILRSPFGPIAIFLLEGLHEQFGEWILVFLRPPEVGRSEHAFGDLRTGFLGEERNLVRDDKGHVGQEAELFGLLARQDRIAAPVDVDKELRA
jgi:hypothetical protein